MTLPTRDPSTPLRAGISTLFRQRVPHFEAATRAPCYVLVQAEYVPDGATRFGPDRHILVDVWDEHGDRMMGVPVNFTLKENGVERIEKITLTNKSAGHPYACDYPMDNHGHSYGCWVGDFREASDHVFGMGLGTIEQPDFDIHVTYLLIFQLTIALGEPPSLPPIPQPQPPDNTHLPWVGKPFDYALYEGGPQGKPITRREYLEWARFYIDKALEMTS